MILNIHFWRSPRHKRKITGRLYKEEILAGEKNIILGEKKDSLSEPPIAGKKYLKFSILLELKNLE